MTFKDLIGVIKEKIETLDVKNYYYAEIVTSSLSEDKQNMEPKIGQYRMSKGHKEKDVYFKYSTVVGLDKSKEEDRWICLLTGRPIDKFGDESEAEKGVLLATDTKPLSEWLEQQETPVNNRMSKNKLEKRLVRYNQTKGYVALSQKKETLATRIRNGF